MDQFSSDLVSQIRRVDEEIYESIRNQAVSSKQTEKDVLSAKTAIRDLYEKIKDIRVKAEQSEVMVEEICKDIKQLDNAKRNLTTTITALHKLQTWVTGIDQLRLMVKTRNFDAAAHLLGAVTDLSKHFEGYANVPKVKRLHDAVSDIRAHLKDEVEDRFREVGTLRVSDRTLGDEEDRQREMSRRARNLERLKPAARVVDAMGEEMRERVIKHFLEDQIREYEDRYGPNNSAGYNLKQVERRYMWYRLLERTCGRRSISHTHTYIYHIQQHQQVRSRLNARNPFHPVGICVIVSHFVSVRKHAIILRVCLMMIAIHTK